MANGTVIRLNSLKPSIRGLWEIFPNLKNVKDGERSVDVVRAGLHQAYIVNYRRRPE